MMVYGVASSVAVWPATSGSPPNLRLHKPALIIATGRPPCLSSSARKLRPGWA